MKACLCSTKVLFGESLYIVLCYINRMRIFFSSVPIDSALNIIKDLLVKDEKLSDRTVLSVQNIIEHLGFCLYNTHFSFQNKFYEQVEGVAMVSLVGPIIANLYMEHFERKALQSASNPLVIGLGVTAGNITFGILYIYKAYQ